MGAGVAAPNLTVRTLADLITGTDSPRVDFPWVGHRSRNWEHQPLRLLSSDAALQVIGLPDSSEARSGQDSTLTQWMWNFLR